MKKRIIIAAIAALTLIGAPTAAFAAETESAPWADTQVLEPTSTSLSKAPLEAKGSDVSPSDETATPSVAYDATGSQPTAPEASSTSAPISTTSTGTASNTQTAPEPSSIPSPELPSEKSPVVAPSPGYVLVLWQNAAGSPKFPQYLVSATKTTRTDVKTALRAAATKCGTFYQSDLYADDARTAALVAKGVLNGGDESWPLNPDGTLNMRYDTFTTEPCPPYTPPVLNCQPGTAPGWINEHGDPTACVDNQPTPPDEPSEPTQPSGEPTAPMTNPEVPDDTDTPTVPTGPLPVDSSSTVKTSAQSESGHANASTSPTPSSSLAYTGSDARNIGTAAGAMIALGFCLVLARVWKLRKR